MSLMRACAWGLLSVTQCKVSGNWTSTVYWAVPVALATWSFLTKRCPITWKAIVSYLSFNFLAADRTARVMNE